MADAGKQTIRRVAHRVGIAACWVVMILYFPVAMSFVNAEKSEVECTRVMPHVVDNDRSKLITESGLQHIVDRAYPALKGTPVSALNLVEMEQRIEQTPVVKRCDIYYTPGGVLHVSIVQREPIMRVFTQHTSYYMDEESFRIAAEPEMSARTVVVSGNVGSMLDGGDVLELCKFIDEDKFWKSQIEQVYITDKQEFVLIPRVGDHVIEFGTIERMEEKFDLLYALYTRGWKPKEWNIYKKVNLKYNGQIICTKR